MMLMELAVEARTNRTSTGRINICVNSNQSKLRYLCYAKLKVMSNVVLKWFNFSCTHAQLLLFCYASVFLKMGGF